MTERVRKLVRMVWGEVISERFALLAAAQEGFLDSEMTALRGALSGDLAVV